MTYTQPQPAAPAFGTADWFAAELRAAAAEGADATTATLGIIETIADGPMNDGEKVACIRNALAAAGSPRGEVPVPARPARRRTGLIVGASVAVVLLAVAGILLGAGVVPSPFSPGLSRDAAERACRTAFEREWQSRLTVVREGGTSGVLASTQRIELQDTWETDAGWSVNGTVHYTLTTGFVAPVADTINLTCTATGADGAPATTVANR